MAKNLLRHVTYLIINILVLAILLQVAIQVYQRSVGVGRDFMIEFIQDNEPTVDTSTPDLESESN